MRLFCQPFGFFKLTIIGTWCYDSSNGGQDAARQERMATRRPSARAEIIRLLKTTGEASASDVASRLGISTVAVRKHLDALEGDGLVTTRRVPVPRGRPMLAYRLTEESESLFPQHYDRLAVELLDDLVALDGRQSLGRLFAAQTERLSHSYEVRLQDKDLSEQLVELARLRDEEGYMAVFEVKDGSFVLREHHCPIFEVAQRHPEACNCEQELFERVLRTAVHLETRLVDGKPFCEYRIEGAPPEETPAS
jgi:predicted ArsR family transcriptional regulator